MSGNRNETGTRRPGNGGNSGAQEEKGNEEEKDDEATGQEVSRTCGILLNSNNEACINPN